MTEANDALDAKVALRTLSLLACVDCLRDPAPVRAPKYLTFSQGNLVCERHVPAL